MEGSVIEGIKAAGVKVAQVSAAGAVAGAGTYAVTGGAGIVFLGTAVGITLGPFMAIGAGIGLTGYGIYWLGKQIGRRSHPPDRVPPQAREEQ